MHIENLFYCSEPHLVEYASKIYKEIAGRVELFVAINKEDLHLALNIDDKHIIYIEDIDETYSFKNIYCNYNKKHIKQAENWYKFCYGLGNDNYIYTHKFNAKNLRGYLACSEYDAYKMSFIYPSYVVGFGKFNNTKINEATINKLIALGFDKSKKTILFLHTWSKSSTFGNDYAISGVSDYKKTSTILQKFSNRCNIIHKNHHNTHKDFKNMINVPNGFDSATLLNIADIIIADYGGSAVEALINSKAHLIYIDADNHSILTKQNLDNALHDMFNGISHNDLEHFLEYQLKSIVRDDVIKAKEIASNFFLGDVYDGAKNFANIIIDIAQNGKITIVEKFVDTGQLDKQKKAFCELMRRPTKK